MSIDFNYNKRKMGSRLYYSLIMLPCDKDVTDPKYVQSEIDYRYLEKEVQQEIVDLPVVKFTGDFMAGGLDKRQQFYLMTSLTDVYFVDTNNSNYAKYVSKIKNLPDISNNIVEDRFAASKDITMLKRTETFSINYNGVDYVLEITEENNGTFTTVEYDGNYLMDKEIEDEILDYFNKYR